MAFDALHDALEILLNPQLRHEVDDLLHRRHPTFSKVLKRLRRLVVNGKSRALLFFSNIFFGRWQEEAALLKSKVWDQPLNSAMWLGKRFELAPSILDRFALLNELFFRRLVSLSLASAIVSVFAL